MDRPSNILTLSGMALVVGRIFRVKKRAAMRMVSLTYMRELRLEIDDELWGELCESFGKPEVPDRKHAVESLLIAVVERDQTKLRVKEAAWMRTNCNGILSLSDYEAVTVEGLISGGHKFLKPQHLHLRFGKHAMLVDFLVSSPNGPFVLEVDPHDSSRIEPRKKLRNQRFEEAKVSFISYNPAAKHPDIRYALPPGFGPWRP